MSDELRKRYPAAHAVADQARIELLQNAMEHLDLAIKDFEDATRGTELAERAATELLPILRDAVDSLGQGWGVQQYIDELEK